MHYNSLALNRMINEVTISNRIKISKHQYENFKQQWIFDAIAGLRYGQAFCRYFGVSNSSPLYYFKDNNISERWIKDNYLV